MFNKIYVEITNYCNLACSFCSKDTLPKKEMTVEEFKIVIDKIKNHTKSIYLHVKGEPLLHSQLDEILDICDKNNIKVSITTNGTLLKQKLNVLLKHHIKQINISLHCENNYSYYFENVFLCADKLSKNTTIIYRIWTLPTLLLNKLSTNIVDKINNYYHLDNTILNKIAKDKNIKIKDNIYLDKDYEFIWPKIDRGLETNGTCLGTRTHIAILSNGTIVPCCLDSNGIIKLGNIFEDNLDNILNSKIFNDINNGFKNNKIICDLCKNCTYRHRFNKKINKNTKLPC